MFNLDQNDPNYKKFSEFFPKNVCIYTSKNSLQGKTTRIKNSAIQRKSKLLTLFIAGNLSAQNILRRLQKLNEEIEEYFNSEKGEKYEKLTLHIKLDITDSSSEYLTLLDQTLFSLLFNKCLKMGNGYLFLDKVDFFDIEISNTLKTQIKSKLGVFYLLEEHTKFKNHIDGVLMGDIDIDLIKEQIPGLDLVAQVLEVAKNGKLLTQDFEIDENLLNGMPIVENEKIKNMLVEAFTAGKNLSDASYRELYSFVRLMEKNFRTFIQCYNISVVNLKETGRSTEIRQTFCEQIIELARRDAWSSGIQIRELQELAFKIREDPKKTDLHNKYKSECKKYQDAKNLEFTNSFSLFFYAGAIKYIYNQRGKMPLIIQEFF